MKQEVKGNKKQHGKLVGQGKGYLIGIREELQNGNATELVLIGHAENCFSTGEMFL